MRNKGEMKVRKHRGEEEERREERKEREGETVGGGRHGSWLVLQNIIWKTWIVFFKVLCPINIYVGTLTYV